jgi:two-component system chemotaxis response regulator CheB
LQVFLQGLPTNLPVPVVIAQHMPPQFTLALARRLNETCDINVVEAKQGDALQAGTVYIAPGGMHLRVGSHGMMIGEDKGESPYKPSVDVLAASAAVMFGKAVIGVMLTGMGADGAREFLALKKLGAHIIGQDQATSVVYGMPRAVAENGAVDDVLPLEKIAPRVRGLLGVVG